MHFGWPGWLAFRELANAIYTLSFFNWWVNISGHVITAELATPISELKPLKCCNLGFLGKFWRSFRPAERYKNLVMTSWVYNTVWTSSCARMSFWAPWSHANSKKWWGAAPLKIPPCVRFNPRRGKKPLVFKSFFCILQFGSISPYFNTFYTSYGV